MSSTTIASLFRALCLITLLAAPSWTLADPLVTRELKHDLSSPLHDVILPAKSGKLQPAMGTQTTTPLGSGERGRRADVSGR